MTAYPFLFLHFMATIGLISGGLPVTWIMMLRWQRAHGKPYTLTLWVAVAQILLTVYAFHAAAPDGWDLLGDMGGLTKYMLGIVLLGLLAFGIQVWQHRAQS